MCYWIKVWRLLLPAKYNCSLKSKLVAAITSLIFVWLTVFACARSVLPGVPRSLATTNIQSTSVLLQFEQGFTGYTSITSWIVESQRDHVESSDAWTRIYSTSDPDASAITVYGLRPYTAYRLRLIAENIAGQSVPSAPTAWFDTLKTVPTTAPGDLTVRALNESALVVRWMVSSCTFLWFLFAKIVCHYVVDSRLQDCLLRFYYYCVVGSQAQKCVILLGYKILSVWLIASHQTGFDTPFLCYNCFMFQLTNCTLTHEARADIIY